jgi:hypothetical protein
LTPYFLAGFTFPDEADEFLSKLGVSDLTAAFDETASVFTGTLQFGDAPRQQRMGKAGFRWDEIEVRFRLTVPRDGATFINTAATTLTQLAGLLDVFLPVDQIAPTETSSGATEYPGVRFRLELMLDEAHFELSDDWRPGKLDADRRVVRDTTIQGPCRIVLPKVVIAYEQTDDFQSPPTLNLSSWGGGGFDSPSTVLAGELVRMEPPIAAYRDGRLGFGLGAVIVDLDPNNTPQEILQFFGTDESFRGFYIQSARIYYADEGKDLAINAGVKDLLISFAGEVSFDVGVDVIGPETTLEARLVVVDGGKNVEVSPGEKRPPSTIITGGKVKFSKAATVQVEVTGGTPPVTISVKDESGAERYDTTTGTVNVAALSPGVHTLSLHVQDGATGTAGQAYDEAVEVTLIAAPSTTATPAGAPADRPSQPGDLPAITMTGGTATKHSIAHAGTVTGTRERFRLLGPGTPTVTIGGASAQIVEGFVEVDVPESTSNLAIAASWAGLANAPERAELRFTKGWPRLEDGQNVINKYLDDTVADAVYTSRQAPAQSGTGTAGVRAWLGQRAIDAGGAALAVTIEAHASWDRDADADTDVALSQRRLGVAVGVVGNRATITTVPATGHADAKVHNREKKEEDRVAIITLTTTQPAETATLLVSRAARTAPTQPPAQPQPTPPPKPLPNKPPGVFRRVGIRVKVIRNNPVLVELTGQLDFETDLEKKLRNPDGGPQENGAGSLGLKQQTAAVSGPNTNPKDGVVDFRLTVVHDPATHSWTETLAIGAHPDDVNGLLQMTNSHAGSATAETRLKDLLGSVAIMAPIIGTAVGATDPGSAGSYAVLGGAVVGAGALGAAGFIRTEKLTLYGGELRFRQFIPPNDPAQFTDAGVLFDYGVEFGVAIDALDIRTTKPLKVRYRAIGFNLNFAGGGYQPIFDTSKGFELDLSDPGLFALPSPIDNVLKIFGARIAKLNPLTVELDLGMKVDLGVVTIDRFKVKLPVDPPGIPTILPSGIKVDISQVLVGSGYVNIIEPPAAPPGSPQPGFGGIEGAFDITLVPVKLRIAASFGVRPITDGTRNATAVFLGLIIDLPAPIPLGQSGIGIYGFSGLFAMHYKRLENDPDPTDATGPAILWLVDAGGEPAKLFNNGKTLWGPEFDRWSFGVGVMLGTMEGGFLVNLRGMFVLELPGPRILVFVKVLIVAVLPDLKPATDLIVGILGVIDLDFRRGTFTIGIIVNLEVKEIVSVIVPVELFADFTNISNWHLFVGTFNSPASAMVLNIVRGFGYFMIAGHNIDNWPGYGTTRTLPGIAVATGVGASVVFGDEGIGLFLKVALRADIAVIFSPRLRLLGRAQLDGELRLFIVSIGAHGNLDVEAPDPTFIKGEVCGHVDFFFFAVEGCVEINIGQKPPPLPPPAIVRNVWLQSHAPVITAGQGGDRPIDASLGDAVPVPANNTSSSENGPMVPIDAVPVIQFAVTPTLDSGLTSFTAPLVQPPGLTPGGWLTLGAERRVTYALKGLRLSGPAPSPGTAKATWRLDTATVAPAGRTNLDLALLSNVPMMGERALERSADLTAIVEGIWGRMCDPIAPPAAVLWTFCRQPLGPSGHGWDLTGHAWPDPPGTVRTTPVDLGLRVDEPTRRAADALLDAVIGHTVLGRIDPPQVIGPNRPPDDRVEPTDPTDPPVACVHLVDVVSDGDKNPKLAAKTFRVTVMDSRRNPYPTLRISGIGRLRGLDIGWRTEIELTRAVGAVSLTLVTFADAAICSALDGNGMLLDRQRSAGQQRNPETVALRGIGIRRLLIETESDETVLVEICLPLRRVDLERPPILIPPLLRAERPTPELPTLRPERPAPVVPPGRQPAAHAAGTKDLACMRALQLPDRSRPGGKGDLDLTPELKQAAQQQPDDRCVDLVTGPVEHARLYVAVAKRYFATDSVVVEQLDVSETVLHSDPLSALAPVFVNSNADLPGEWTDPGGPWAAEVIPVAALLEDPSFAALIRMWITVHPKPETVRLRLRIVASFAPAERPAALLAVAEVLTLAEGQRYTTEEGSRSGQVETVAGYLNGTAAVPLLSPGQKYTLHIDYTATTEDTPPSGPPVVSTFNFTESFRFSTDARPPARLDAYVLGGNPRQEEQFVFADEVVTVVFNDLQVVQLYQKYGRTLTAVLRSADGVAIPAHQVQNISEVAATYTSPLYDTLNAKVRAGGFPCVGPYHHEGHAQFQLPEQLRPSMAYSLDIEARPVPAHMGPNPIVPLFRRQFRTGRFRNVSEFVGEMKARALEHRPLTGPITGLTPGVAADVAIEAALRAAGLPGLGAPTQGSRIVLWRPLGNRYVPHAVLLDASEPLWRFRDTPKQEVVPNADPTQPPLDPSFQRIVPGEEPSLRLEATGPVTGFVRSTAGTRTIVFLNDSSWPTTGGNVVIEAVRTASALYGVSEQRVSVTSLQLAGQAPWEDDDA